ncbi:nucleoredoxin-like protein 1 isoform X2 [Sminthopsis crassicaudata]|uniref:nucleoredoxin-like protein 1 isoform X2 n=2 Tax=Sminthopsis crassicaudata TaxID=9301 RepID=UPI003D69A830
MGDTSLWKGNCPHFQKTKQSHLLRRVDMMPGGRQTWDDRNILTAALAKIQSGLTRSCRWEPQRTGMSSLFTGKVLIRNNSDCDEVDTEQELSIRLDNKVLLLYFGSGECPQCQAFAPVLKDFFVKLTDEFYVNRASQIALVYISQDQTQEQQESFLKDMPRKWLFLPFQDELKRDLGRMFAVDHVPMVVVLKPSGEVVTRDAVEEIGRLGPACFWNWQEASEVIDRNFLLAEDFDDLPPRSLTDPIRRLKYKIEKESSKDDLKEEEHEDKAFF